MARNKYQEVTVEKILDAVSNRMFSSNNPFEKVGIVLTLMACRRFAKQFS